MIEHVKVGEISNILAGNAWKSSQFSKTPPGLPIARIQNVTNGLSEFVYWTGKFNEKYVINNGDFLLSLSGNVKLCEWKLGQALLNQRVVRLEPHEGVSKRYFYWSLNQIIAELQALAKHAVIANVSILDLKNFQIPLPPLAEQKRIAGILDRAEGLRRKRARAITLTNTLLRSVFLDMFGDPVTNPMGWETQLLSNISNIRSGITKGRKLKSRELIDVPYMRVANVQDGYLKLDEISTIAATLEERERYLLAKGDILLTEGGDPDKLGRGAVWDGEVETCIHQNHIFCVRLNDHLNISPLYVSTLIGSQYGKRFFLRAAKQTTGIASINKTQLKDFPVLLPPESLQIEYERFAAKLKSHIAKLDRGASKAVSLTACLTQRAFRGELTGEDANG